MNKVALFIDAFITSDEKFNVFTNNVHKFSQCNWDIFIISNKIFSFDKFSQVKYFEYDSENRILKDSSRYILPDVTHIWSEFHLSDGKHMFEGNFPSHGYTNWTILHNLKKISTVLKKKGYTHFIRCEYDVDLKDYNIMSTIFKNFEKTERSVFGMGTIGDGKTHPGLVTNLFLISVDYVLNLIPDLDTEDDYEKFMMSVYGTATSPVFESLFMHLVKDKIELMDQGETFQHINKIGVCSSDGGDHRHQSFRKNLLCSLINDDTGLLVWNTSYDSNNLIEISIDGRESLYKLHPRSFTILNCTTEKIIEIKSSLMSPNDKIIFDKNKKYNYATLRKI